MKTIRSHVQKMLHRYIVKHAELRDENGVAHTIEAFQQICKVKRALLCVIITCVHASSIVLLTHYCTLQISRVDPQTCRELVRNNGGDATYIVSWYLRYRVVACDESDAAGTVALVSRPSIRQKEQLNLANSFLASVSNNTLGSDLWGGGGGGGEDDNVDGGGCWGFMGDLMTSSTTKSDDDDNNSHEGEGVDVHNATAAAAVDDLQALRG